MTELKVYLSEELDKKFRRIAMSIYGYGRGSLSKAAEEAFTRWCAEHEQSSSKSHTNTAPNEMGEQTRTATESVIDPDEREKPGNLGSRFDEKDSMPSTSSSPS